MESSSSLQLAGVEIHGFRTEADLNIEKLLKEASLRWFRPNEVHAILFNHTLLKIQPQPVNLPKSGCVLLFDRKMLRNFRKDGYNWKKKKDGKTVQEAHEKLKIGNEERIHVYYARGEDDPSFYRRCYWLLDKNLERMVLVHYRHTSEDNAVNNLPIIFESPEVLLSASEMHHFSPTTNSISVSAQSDKSGSASLSEEINSGEHYANYAAESTDIKKHEFSLHEINTLDWADLVEHVEVPECTGSAIHREGDTLCYDQQVQYELRNSMKNGNFLSSQGTYLGTNFEVVGNQEDLSPPLLKNMKPNSQTTNLLLNAVCTKGTPGMFNDDAILTQDSCEQWNNMGNDSLGLHNLRPPETVGLKGDQSDAHITMDPSSTQQQIFCITDISPSWAYCTEETKVLVIGYFSDEHKHLEGCNIRCVIDGICVMTEMVQVGVYRCKALAQIPGLVDLYFSLDGRFPISQNLNFEYRSIPAVKFGNGVSLSEDDMVKCEEFKFQLRLAHLLFSTSNELSILSERGQSNSLKAAKKYSSLTSPSMKKEWMGMLQASSNNSISNNSIGKDLLEMVLKNKLQQWLLEKIAGGVKTPARDSQGQGVIHLCARLDYSWSVRLFSFSGLSLDFRDAFGWTALHWAAYHGREKMVAALLSFGANPSMVTDPTPESPGGCTAADLASIAKYDGLAAYLAEKGLTAHFEAMTLSGNITAPPQAMSAAIPLNPMDVNSELLSEQDLCLKESLAAYRNAANAADRIQAAFRDRSLKLQTRAVQLAKPEMEAIDIISAMKIQHAFRKFNRRKMMWAAANIQSHFRTWQMRKNYLNMRKQAIRIQAVFRGHQVRKQYHKVIWSVGVLEKAILRWRLKRRGLRGLQVTEVMKVDNKEEESNAEEEFYRVGREQAEDRVKRSVIRVQSMFRSYKAQQEYRRMKLAHEQAKLEYNEPQC